MLSTLSINIPSTPSQLTLSAYPLDPLAFLPIKRFRLTFLLYPLNPLSRLFTLPVTSDQTVSIDRRGHQTAERRVGNARSFVLACQVGATCLYTY